LQAECCNVTLYSSVKACNDDSDHLFYWDDPNVNFDNALNGFFALFQVATFEGWMEVMQASVDSVGVDMQPRRENRFAAYFFYVTFIIVGAFFVINLFVGVTFCAHRTLGASAKLLTARVGHGLLCYLNGHHGNFVFQCGRNRVFSDRG
jgi:hypothetical protein